MKKLAVEWLKRELTEVERNLINKTFLQLNNSLAGHKLKDIFEQAKAMEKQQMKSIYSPTIMQNEDGKLYVKDFEQYYDETFDNK